MKVIKCFVDLAPQFSFLFGVLHVRDMLPHLVIQTHFCDKISSCTILLVLKLRMVLALIYILNVQTNLVDV